MRFLSDIAESMADSIWWFKGAQYARPASIDAGSGDCQTLEIQTSKARAWILDILAVRKRVIAPPEEISRTAQGVKLVAIRNDGGLIAITFAELETLHDAVRHGAHGEDLKRARALTEQLHTAYKSEVEAMRQRTPDLPF